MDGDRLTAYRTLLRVFRDGAYSNLILNRLIEKDPPRNPAFVRELVYGTIRRKLRLDYDADQLSKKPVRQLDPEVAVLLRMGLYQLSFMDSVPAYAAVSECVDIAKREKKSAAAFVNGVLRTYLRQKETLKKPEQETDPVRRFVYTASADASVVRLFLRQYGEDRAAAIFRAVNRTPRLTAVVNTRKTTRGDLIRTLEDSGFGAEPDPDCEAVVYPAGSGVLDSEAFRNGLFFIEGKASRLAVETAAPRAGERVIDCCAAPGGKSFSAALLAEDRGDVRSFDIYPNKVKLIEKEAARLGLSSVQASVLDAETPDKSLFGTADVVICDVPCSGIGVMAEKPEIKYKKLRNNGESFAEKQYTIIDQCAQYVRAGGRLLYSTCTLNERENEAVVRRFLGNRPAFRTKTEKTFFPDTDGTDGFYIHLMEREMEEQR